MEPIEVILVGGGKIGKSWLKTILDNPRWKIKGVVDLNKEILRELKDYFPLEGVVLTEDFREAFKKIPASSCIIATPINTHIPIAIEAIENGLAILCEKPLTLDWEGVNSLLSLYRKKRPPFLVNQNYRSHPGIREMRKFIKKKKTGKIGYISLRFHRYLRTGDWREKLTEPILMDMSIHHFDLLRFLLGKDLQKVIAVKSFHPPWSWMKGNGAVTAILEFEENIIVDYYGSWVERGISTPWVGNWKVEGEKGAIYLEKDKKLFFVPAEKEIEIPIPIREKEFSNPLNWTLEKFENAVRGKEDPEVKGITLEENLKSLRIIQEILSNL